MPRGLVWSGLRLQDDGHAVVARQAQHAQRAIWRLHTRPPAGLSACLRPPPLPFGQMDAVPAALLLRSVFFLGGGGGPKAAVPCPTHPALALPILSPRHPDPPSLPAGMEEKERPWLKAHVHTPAARDPEEGATRKRPLIYVYELPPFYNSVMLQVGAGPGKGSGRAGLPFFSSLLPPEAYQAHTHQMHMPSQPGCSPGPSCRLPHDVPLLPAVPPAVPCVPRGLRAPLLRRPQRHRVQRHDAPVQPGAGWVHGWVAGWPAGWLARWHCKERTRGHDEARHRRDGSAAALSARPASGARARTPPPLLAAAPPHPATPTPPLQACTRRCCRVSTALWTPMRQTSSTYR